MYDNNSNMPLYPLNGNQFEKDVYPSHENEFGTKRTSFFEYDENFNHLNHQQAVKNKTQSQYASYEDSYILIKKENERLITLVNERLNEIEMWKKKFFFSEEEIKQHLLVIQNQKTIIFEIQNKYNNAMLEVNKLQKLVGVIEYEVNHQDEKIFDKISQLKKALQSEYQNKFENELIAQDSVYTSLLEEIKEFLLKEKEEAKNMQDNLKNKMDLEIQRITKDCAVQNDKLILENNSLKDRIEELIAREKFLQEEMVRCKIQLEDEIYFLQDENARKQDIIFRDFGVEKDFLLQEIYMLKNELISIKKSPHQDMVDPRITARKSLKEKQNLIFEEKKSTNLSAQKLQGHSEKKENEVNEKMGLEIQNSRRAEKKELLKSGRKDSTIGFDEYEFFLIDNIKKEHELQVKELIIDWQSKFNTQSNTISELKLKIKEYETEINLLREQCKKNCIQVAHEAEFNYEKYKIENQKALEFAVHDSRVRLEQQAEIYKKEMIKMKEEHERKIKSLEEENKKIIQLKNEEILKEKLSFEQEKKICCVTNKEKIEKILQMTKFKIEGLKKDQEEELEKKLQIIQHKVEEIVYRDLLIKMSDEKRETQIIIENIKHEQELIIRQMKEEMIRNVEDERQKLQYAEKEFEIQLAQLSDNYEKIIHELGENIKNEIHNAHKIDAEWQNKYKESFDSFQKENERANLKIRQLEDELTEKKINLKKIELESIDVKNQINQFEKYAFTKNGTNDCNAQNNLNLEKVKNQNQELLDITDKQSKQIIKLQNELLQAVGRAHDLELAEQQNKNYSKNLQTKLDQAQDSQSSIEEYKIAEKLYAGQLERKENHIKQLQEQLKLIEDMSMKKEVKFQESLKKFKDDHAQKDLKLKKLEELLMMTQHQKRESTIALEEELQKNKNHLEETISGKSKKIEELEKTLREFRIDFNSLKDQLKNKDFIIRQLESERNIIEENRKIESDLQKKELENRLNQMTELKQYESDLLKKVACAEKTIHEKDEIIDHLQRKLEKSCRGQEDQHSGFDSIRFQIEKYKEEIRRKDEIIGTCEDHKNEFIMLSKKCEENIHTIQELELMLNAQREQNNLQSIELQSIKNDLKDSLQKTQWLINEKNRSVQEKRDSDNLVKSLKDEISFLKKIYESNATDKIDQAQDKLYLLKKEKTEMKLDFEKQLSQEISQYNNAVYELKEMLHWKEKVLHNHELNVSNLTKINHQYQEEIEHKNRIIQEYKATINLLENQNEELMRDVQNYKRM